jgi:hypothetical protein
VNQAATLLSYVFALLRNVDQTLTGRTDYGKICLSDGHCCQAHVLLSIFLAILACGLQCANSAPLACVVKGAPWKATSM